MSEVDISVAICTHNPRRDFLKRTVDGLKRQTLPTDRWEFSIIDNGSQPAVESSYVDWHPAGRVIREDELGLTPARIRAIRETTSPWVMFVDDDNDLDQDYLECALEIAEKYPFLGAFGSSQILPEYEVEPTDRVRPFVKKLAVRDVATAIYSNDPRDGCDPWGAGMLVRREVAEAYVKRVRGDDLRMSLDRRGDALNSAGDTEFSWLTCEMGYAKGIFPQLKMKHLIDKKRVTEDYMVRITEGHSFSHTMIRFLHAEEISQRLNRLNPAAAAVSRSPNSKKQKFFHSLAYLVNALPWSKNYFTNRLRLASYRGQLRAHAAIDAISEPSR